MKCVRCGGGLMQSWGELICLACGWEPYTVTTEQREMLDREHARLRRRQPSTSGQKL